MWDYIEAEWTLEAYPAVPTGFLREPEGINRRQEKSD
jgi:hypothetical protein